MESYTIRQLKEVIVKYNLKTKIAGYSKQNKDDLIANIKKHLDHNNGTFTPKIIQPIIIKNNFDTTPIKVQDIKKEEPKEYINEVKKEEEEDFIELTKKQLSDIKKSADEELLDYDEYLKQYKNSRGVGRNHEEALRKAIDYTDIMKKDYKNTDINILLIPGRIFNYSKYYHSEIYGSNFFKVRTVKDKTFIGKNILTPEEEKIFYKKNIRISDFINKKTGKLYTIKDYVDRKY